MKTDRARARESMIRPTPNLLNTGNVAVLAYEPVAECLTGTAVMRFAL
jgi:hypothetical protein